MIETLIKQLQQQFSQIQRVELLKQDGSSITWTPEASPSTQENAQEAKESSSAQETSDEQTSSEDSSEEAAQKAPDEETQKAKETTSEPPAKDSEESSKETEETETTTDESSNDSQVSTSTGEVHHLKIVTEKYDLHTNDHIMRVLLYKSKHYNVQVVPFIISQKESEQFQQLGTDGRKTPLELLNYFAKQSDYPRNAYKHTKIAMGELKRLLRLVEQEFPTSGLHALSVGNRVQLLFDNLMEWLFATFDRTYQGTPEDEAFFTNELCGQDKVFPAEFSAFPFLLRAFITRHQAVAHLLPQTYGDNDLELERLLTPLKKALHSANRYFYHHFTPPEVYKRRKKRWRLILGLGGVTVLLIAVFFIFFKGKPEYFPALKKFKKGKQAGGIVLRFYKGKKFKKYLNKRQVQKLDHAWPTRPTSKVPKNHFSMRAKGFIRAPEYGVYKLCLRYDDGARLFIGKRKVIEDWTNGAARRSCKKLLMAKGWHKLRVDLYEKTGRSEIRLLWQTPKSKSKYMLSVPPKNLCCKKKRKKKRRKKKKRKKRRKKKKKSKKKGKKKKGKKKKAKARKRKAAKKAPAKRKAKKVAKRKPVPSKEKVLKLKNVKIPVVPAVRVKSTKGLPTPKLLKVPKTKKAPTSRKVKKAAKPKSIATPPLKPKR